MAGPSPAMTGCIFRLGLNTSKLLAASVIGGEAVRRVGWSNR
jgi:hypothetical protein